MSDITSKIEAMRTMAQENLKDDDDYFNEVSINLAKAMKIKDDNKIHNENKSNTLYKAFYASKKDFYKKQKDDTSYKNAWEDTKNAYIKYAQGNASLDKVGETTMFLDALSDSYIRIERYVDKDRLGNSHDRIRTDRITQKVLHSFIDEESKKMIGSLLKTTEIGFIRRELHPFFKEFNPLKEKFYGKIFNTYTPNGFLDVKINNKVNLEKFVNVSMPKRYPIINSLMINIAPENNERIYLLNWLSTILNTAQKTKTAPVLKGIQRTGKGVFATQLIEYAMHESNCFIATNSNLADSFNGYLEDKLFITFDEVKGDFKSDKDIGNKIKQIVSEDRHQIRTMHTNPYMIQLHCNCIFLSNDDLPIPMDQSDGRFTIIETTSRRLSDVAEKDFSIDIDEFVRLLKEERDNFLIHLKMCEFNKKWARSTIENQAKQIIKDSTATHEAVLKTTFRNQDIASIDELIDEAIQDILSKTLIKKEFESLKENSETGEKFKIKDTISFEHRNEVMKIIFMKEFKAGLMSNTSLKWFSKALNLDHIQKDDKKFGSFWNKVISGITIINMKTKNQSQKKERFRKIKPHEEIKNFHFNNMDFVLISSKTAEEVSNVDPF